MKADRSAARGQRGSAVIHGIAAAMIAFPLILFMALSFYGGALIVTPGLMRRET